MSVAQSISLLDNIIERMPKEGYMASVVLGVLEAIRGVLRDIGVIEKKIVCIATAKDSCKNQLCDPGCGGIVKIEFNSTSTIVKQKNNPFSIRVSNGLIEIGSKMAKIRLEGNVMEISLPSGESLERTRIDLSDRDQVYENVYTIKYAMKTIISPLRKSIAILNNCARNRAIVC